MIRINDSMVEAAPPHLSVHHAVPGQLREPAIWTMPVMVQHGQDQGGPLVQQRLDQAAWLVQDH